MGNSSTKEHRPTSSAGHSRPSSVRNVSSPTASGPPGTGPSDRLAATMYTAQAGRRSRPDLSFLGIGSSADREAPTVETRRETKAEREARRLERERAAREKERERSVREEGVDGGYLVTLGTYIGPEDFNKQIVRQLMIERRLAPFWRGLNDYNESWKEHQLIAAVKGLPIPAADDVPPEDAERSTSPANSNPRSSDLNINHLTVPIAGRSQSATSDRSANLSPSHPAFSLPPPSSPIANSPSSPFFRSRAKTLASLTTSSRNNSQTEMTPQEIQLPKDPYVNGMRIETFLYKDGMECPVCFLYYPPYLNKTRCCDQPICSECFVQIKRPDPHPPEHHDDPSNPNPPAEPQEDNLLVSEPSKCPYCTQSEFGVTYDPPPFRRGLAYSQPPGHSLARAKATSAMSSSSSLNSQGLTSPGGTRRRTTSLSVNAPEVISTDKIRPDWAKKLADARAHALRRAAAATALHNAAYVLGNAQISDSRSFGLGRRRRTMFGTDSPNSSGRGTPRQPGLGSVSSPQEDQNPGEREGQNDLFPGRHSSRRTRVEDLEELMMMEAIRLSLAAEEERKRKEEKEAAKEAKKEEKRKAKEAKKAEKASRKSGLFLNTDSDANRSRSSVNVLAGNTVNILAGKGKAVDRSAGETTSGEPSGLTPSTSKDDPQRHLEQSRAQIQSHVPDSPFAPSVFNALGQGESSHRTMLRQISTNNSSSASSIAESVPGSLPNGDGFGASASSFGVSPNASGVSITNPAHEATASNIQSETPPTGGDGTEPMFNFRSLASVIVDESKNDGGSSNAEHIENLSTEAKPELAKENESIKTRSRGDSGESSKSSPPPVYVQDVEAGDGAKPRPADVDQADVIEPVVESVPSNEPSAMDQKHIGEVSVVGGNGHTHQATQ